jgi:arsenate reductase
LPAWPAFATALSGIRSTGTNGGQSMKATIYHNPRCGTSRKTLEILEQEGAEVTVVDYLKHPPSKQELKRLYDRASMTPEEGLRAKESLAEDLDLLSGRVSDDAVLDAMVANPILIERPLVETEKGVRLCRPQDKVREIL